MARKAESWILPKIDWVFQRCGFQPPVPDNLLEQLDLGFAFTAPLNIKVIKDNGTAPGADPRASDCVLGAPAGHAAIEKGCPPGRAVPAAAAVAADESQQAAPAAAPPDAALAPAGPGGKGRGRGKGKGRGRGNASPKAAAAVKTKAKAKAASAPAPAADGSAPKRRRNSIPSDAEVGCAKCYHNKEVGCTTCRPKAGLVESAEKGKWVWKTGDSA